MSFFSSEKRSNRRSHSIAKRSESSSNASLINRKIGKLLELYKNGQFDLVARRASKFAEEYPSTFMFWNLAGAATLKTGRPAKAEKAFARATELNPEYPEAHNNLGNALMDQRRFDEAVECYRRALRVKPDYAEAHSNLGNALSFQGRLEEAVTCYQYALQIRPEYAEALGNLGNALKNQGRLEDAITCYRRALRISPDFAHAHSNLGNTLRIQGKLDEAVECLKRALKINPEFAEAHEYLGIALRSQGKLEDAMTSFRRALQIRPDYASVQSEIVNQQAQMCSWSYVAEFKQMAPKLGIEGERALPFTLLAMEDNPERQLQRSRFWARETYRQEPTPLPAIPAKRPEKIRIGYFSANFYEFPGMFLMAGLFEHHDRKSFETFAFSYGPNKRDPMRERISRAFDHFIDVKDLSDAEIVKLAREKSIDIAIDRNGYTKSSRTELFAYRLAPIQINYLGYPSTMGADFIDYIVADPVVIPENQKKFYSEKIIYLPHSYLPNDDQRVIAETSTTRSDFGLPDEAFVFCCFNNSFKIGPREFDIWMRLLQRVEGSVLWLLHLNEWAEKNLRKEAKSRGVDPDRLVFADWLPNAEHLARHRQADLFIDVFNYNAHTTASDALWAGLPVVTKAGDQFAARVAASLLNAVGLPELITGNEQDYEALILDLAINPGKLSAIRSKLAGNRLTMPLFDTARYTRDFEKGLKAAYDRYYNGDAPADIVVGKAPVPQDKQSELATQNRPRPTG